LDGADAMLAGGALGLEGELRRRLLAEPGDEQAATALVQLLHAAGRLDEAADAIGAAAAQRPRQLGLWSAYGNALREAGRTAEAVRASEKAVRLAPKLAELHHNLGCALRDHGDDGAAAKAFRRAVSLKPSLHQSWNNLGWALLRTGRIAEAEAAFRRSLAVAPDHRHARTGLLETLVAQDRRGEARALVAAIDAPGAEDADAFARLADIAAKEEDGEGEAAALERALTLAPRRADLIVRLASVLARIGRTEESWPLILRAIGTDPEAVAASHAAIFEAQGEALDLAPPERFSGAFEERRRAAERMNRATALLAAGDLAQGFQQYEWRIGALQLEEPSSPRWNGEALAGRTLLVLGEQGFGDVIQFARFVPLLAEAGGKVVLAVQPELRRLAASLPGVASVTALGETLPAHDVHCFVMSLPHLRGVTLSSIPNAVPYLALPPEVAARWRARLSAPAGLKVGLAWAGRPTHMNDRVRSIPLDAFAPLAAIDGLALFALQKGSRLADTLSFPGPIDPIGAEIEDFADAAGVVLGLDVVVSIDSAMAHLAGALGRPCITLLPDAAEWRWMLAREDSPWYPTMRLWRQPAPGDWPSLIARLAATLEGVIRQRRPSAA
jgi:tetratricopeptide (TPR) repeat protein